MTNEKYLFFRDVADEDNVGSGKCVLVPASTITGMVATGTTTLRIAFNSLKNELSSPNSGNEVVSDYVELTLKTANTHIDVSAAIMRAINGRNEFIVVADDVTTFVDESTRGSGEYIHAEITGCAITLADTLGFPESKAVSGTSHATKFNSYAVGAVSETVPAYSQTREGKEIITTIEIDLQNLGVEGTAAKDVIGIETAAPNAWIARYYAADMGTLYKAEIICTEIPSATGGAGTITTDIDFGFNSSKSLGFDDALSGTSLIDTGGFAAIGSTTVSIPVPPTNEDYLYIIEGDAAADASTTNTYGTGKLVLRLFGR